MSCRRFTLMEVMIATTILAMSVVATMGIIGGARSSILRAEKRWARQHLLSSVAELYLTGGVHAIMPDGLLPQGFSSSCTLSEVEDIHEEAQESIHEWRLGEYHIRVFDASNNLMGELKIRKLVKEDDL